MSKRYRYIYIQTYSGDLFSYVWGSLANCHKRSPLHHIDSHNTYHTGLHFPSSIALITQLSPITCSPESHYTCTILNPLRSFSNCRVLSSVYRSPSDSYSMEQFCVFWVWVIRIFIFCLCVYLGLTLCLLFRTQFTPRLDYCSCYWITPHVKPSEYCSPIVDPR